ncbi:glycosyltransferase family A protein [Methylobacterium sp. GC_Met_2]|uniref:glycosyltransferase family 2 protein n=1 Tax=Methylobacterium sp. GC_Met_2 TaxID=2937376 RepID=UPI00226B7739|nr:glycosyltransferase family A protein [Methylobacterium sp. GC_Met_2]
MIDVSVIINLHHEGRLCQGTLESVIEAARLGENLSISTEILCIIDNGNRATLDAVDRYKDIVRIHECAFRDLSKARNFGVSVCKGKFITFIDGDDLWGNQWIARCLQLAHSRQNSKLIIHPQMNVFFGNHTPPSLWIHPNVLTNEIDLADIFVANKWTALSFAAREIYEAFPYVPNEIDQGFGYEDWLWNIQTLLEGFEHMSCPKTCHFIRRKGEGSLLAATNARQSIPNLYQLKDFAAFKQSLSKVLQSEQA